MSNSNPVIRMTVVVKRVGGSGVENNQGKNTTITLSVPENQHHLAAKVFMLLNKVVTVEIREQE